MFWRVLIFQLALAIQIQSRAQCVNPVPDPQGTCNTGTDIQLTDGANVNSGQVYYFSGGPVTFANVALNGGLLRICGDLTISNMSFNGGKIIIASSGSLNFTHSAITLSVGDQDITNYGSLTINSGFNVNANSEVINEGTITLTTSTTAEGTASLVYNAPGGVILMAGLNANIGNQFINYGTAVFGNLTVQGSGGVCMGSGAIVEADNLTNNTANSITAISGSSCISYSGTATMNQVLTNSTNLTICKKPGAQNPTGAGFGSATVINNCSSCLQALPVTLSSFIAATSGEQVTLTWVSEMEDNVEKYVVEQGSMGNAFVPVAEITALNRPNTYTYLTTIASTALFRLKIVDLDGQYVYSKVLLVRPGSSSTRVTLLKNPVTDGIAHLSIYSESVSKADFLLYDATGRVVKKLSMQLSVGNNFLSIPLNGLNSSVYTLIYKDNISEPVSLRLVKIGGN